MKRKRKLGLGQRRLLAEFTANMAVAWFAGGVIGAIFSNIRDPFELFWTISAGLFFSFTSLFFGLYLIKGVRI